MSVLEDPTHMTRRDHNIPYPVPIWDHWSPAAAGFDPLKMVAAKQWLEAQAKPTKTPYRIVIVRGGKIVVEWEYITSRGAMLELKSAAKSVFATILGMAILDGKIGSVNDRVVDYYPEMMDVPKGCGPKPGRYAFEKDRAITFRHLISNTSGYMKPGEEPGQVFHYQTYGMNILTHAIAKTYGLYDSNDPDHSPGLNALIDDWLKKPLRAHWDHYVGNFDLHPDARTHIFGNYQGMKATALDMARLGWLWCMKGIWKRKRLIPIAWLEEATHTAPDILANCPEDQWRYGYGFWTNDHGKLWPHLPRDSFAASGAGKQHIWVCPRLELIVVQSPGIYEDQADNDTGLLRL
ncbi:MAG: serine hydrolase, partial [Anaerolineae bacterium]|nr:serine hydrolase [Anaerolineae bacterium]